MMKILITGAAGNLGSLLSRHLLTRAGLTLRLMTHRRDVPAGLKVNGKSEVIQADLADNGFRSQSLMNLSHTQNRDKRGVTEITLARPPLALGAGWD